MKKFDCICLLNPAWSFAFFLVKVLYTKGISYNAIEMNLDECIRKGCVI